MTSVFKINFYLWFSPKNTFEIFITCIVFVEHGTFTISAFLRLSFFFPNSIPDGVLDTFLCDKYEVPTRGSV